MPLSHGRLLVVRPGGSWDIARVVDLKTGATRSRLPAGQIGGNLLVHKDGRLLTWFNLATGARVADAVLERAGQYSLIGASQNGARAVLVRNQRRNTTFVIVSKNGYRPVQLGTNSWGFDALSGNKLYLLHYLRGGYEVRLYDLGTNRLQAAPLKDQEEAALIPGTPWVRASTPDGRYLFTLYIKENGSAMVHELDTRNAVARCIDLPASRDFNTAATYTLTLDSNASTLWAVSTGDGKVAAIDVAAAKVRDAFSFPATEPGSPSGGSAAISPDGEHIAVAFLGDLWVVTPARHRVVKQPPHAAIALGFSTDGRKLWVVGQRSRLSALPITA